MVSGDLPSLPELQVTQRVQETTQSRPAQPDSELPQPTRRAPPELPQPSLDSAETEDRPTLPELLRFKIPQQVSTDYTNFGIFLLEDRTGSRVDAIEDECRGKPDRITRKILQEWVGGRGAALTWDTLVKTLRDCELNTLADHVQASKLPHAP